MIFTIWDIGGCDKIRPLWRHYYQNTQALIFVIDSNDRERVDEAIEELTKMLLTHDDLKVSAVLIFANKQDLDSALSIEEITNKLNFDKLLNINWKVQGTTAVTGDGLHEGLDWLATTLKSLNNENSLPKLSIFRRNSNSSSQENSMPSDKELLERIQQEKENDIPELNIDFLNDFKQGKIHIFDHRAHLRVGFIILYNNMKNGIKTSKSVDIFIQTLKEFFENSDRKQIRLTFHITMSIFWCHIINLALSSFVLSDSYDESLNEEVLFVQFLEMFPSLMWSSLWTKHYSKSLLMSPKAKTEFVLPDLSPFPAYITLQNTTMITNQNENVTNDELNDDEFFYAYENSNLFNFNEIDLIRICFLKLQKLNMERRAKIVNDLMDSLQKLLMRLRASGNSKLIYSQTQIYFWIQIINAALASLQFTSNDISTDDLNFHSFCILFPEFISNQNPPMYEIYYSKDRFESMEARRSFITPDKKALPNFFTKRQVNFSFIQENIQRVPFTLLKMLSTDIIDLLQSDKVDEWENNLKGYQMSDNLLLDSIQNGKIEFISHLDMIRMMYIHIITGWELGIRGTVAVTKIVDDFESYWMKNEIQSSEFPDCNDVESKETIKSNILGNRFNRSYSGITHLHFWIQMISICITKSTYYHQNALQSFTEFISCFPELLYDRLWNSYYSHQSCFSPEARTMVLPADITPLPAFIKRNKK